ncbi:MAG TPA: hypothetical protein PK867_01510, partial [Pirellulales bacterium]|nr:hypothetical protein [Pirellulales bacterium]
MYAMTTAADDRDGQTDVAFLLDVLFDHKMVWIQQLLKDKGLSAVGNKPDLRRRVEGYLEDAALETTDLVDVLDRVEGWGNQHIYLYKASSALIATLSDEAKLKDRLRKLKLARLFNGRIPLVLPDPPALSAIEWQGTLNGVATTLVYVPTPDGKHILEFAPSTLAEDDVSG